MNYLENKNQSVINDTKNALNRIYALGPLQRHLCSHNNDDDDNDNYFIYNFGQRRNNYKPSSFRSSVGQESQRRAQPDEFLETTKNKNINVEEMKKNFELQCEVLQRERDRERAEKEKELEIAKKLHEFAIEEMKAEKDKLEKLLNEKSKKKKKQKKNKIEEAKLSNEQEEQQVQVSACSSQSKIEAKEENDFINCVVCMDAKREILCMPCLHVALCLKCSLNLQKCPVCMSEAEMKRIFLS